LKENKVPARQVLENIKNVKVPMPCGRSICSIKRGVLWYIFYSLVFYPLKKGIREKWSEQSPPKAESFSLSVYQQGHARLGTKRPLRQPTKQPTKKQFLMEPSSSLFVNKSVHRTT
jgi:hypothetical protein